MPGTMNTEVLITFLTLWITIPLVVSTPVGLRAASAQDLIESIPKEDRGLFIAFHLYQALNTIKGIPRYSSKLPKETKIPHDKYEKFKGITTYSEFSSQLLHWTKATFNMTNSDVNTLVTTFSTVCFPDGCFDANDVGALCCPF